MINGSPVRKVSLNERTFAVSSPGVTIRCPEVDVRTPEKFAEAGGFRCRWTRGPGQFRVFRPSRSNPPPAFPHKKNPRPNQCNPDPPPPCLTSPSLSLLPSRLCSAVLPECFLALDRPANIALNFLPPHLTRRNKAFNDHANHGKRKG